MLILQDLFLWAIVSALIVGGAMVFHRYFPQESPWFGFLVPTLTLVLLLNFIEHLVALPTLLYLLPVLLGGAGWAALARRDFVPALYLPAGVFLASFAFTFAVRCVIPNIDFTSDGISDLNMVNNYSQGQTLPPPDCWMPPYRYEWYYGMQHYAASVLGRLLGVRIGVAYNVAHALLSALTCVVAAGAAWRISGGKVWITLAVPFLLESTMTGSSAYIFLTSQDPSVWLSSDLSGGMMSPPDGNPLWRILFWDPRPEIAHLAKPEILRLQVPGFWTWRSEFHANASGHLLTLLAVLTIAELTEARRTIWPWVLGVLTPLLAAVASAWALPITVLLCWGALPLALGCGRRPGSVRMALGVLFVGLTLIWPAFYSATSSPEVPPIVATQVAWRAPVLEFVIQWWPILALWICGLVLLRDVPFGLRWVMLVVPVMLIGVELVTIESRYNTVEKMWGYTWGAALVGLFPFVAARAGLACRLVTWTILASALISLIGFVKETWRWAPPEAMFHLEGDNFITGDKQKSKMLEAVRQVKHATFLSGKCVFCYNEAPTLGVFTGNRSYIAWYWFESLTNNMAEANERSQLDNDFYSGAMTNRLQFLQENDIEGVLIWPDDNLDNAFVEKLKQELGPTYEYLDCKEGGQQNAGVFLRKPLPRG